jgi:thioredoxin reductase (NADPH)
MATLSPEDKDAIREIVSKAVRKPVEVLLFSQKFACESCSNTVRFLKELASLNQNIMLKVVFLEDEAKLAERLSVDNVPAILIRPPHGEYNMRFLGFPGGYEFPVLLEGLAMASVGTTAMKDRLRETVKKIDKSIRIKIFTTPTCPYCPTVGRIVFMAAIENPHVNAEVIEISEYPYLSQKYDVKAVPKTVINDRFALEGAYSMDNFVRMLATIAGVKVSVAERGVTDVGIIGGGGAGVTAAIYAIRQGLKTVLLERENIGGQLFEASTVDNYPGLYGTLGPEIAQVFNSHLTELDADIVYDEATDVTKKDDIFEVKLKSGEILRSKTVIIASGMKHRKLEVPNEEKLQGKGVSYCATCDGDLFRGKKTAVIGGGSTAVSYALYLSYISEKTFLIHRRSEFKAENILLEQLKARPNITILVPYVVTEIIGESAVNKLRVKNTLSGQENTIDIDGIFVSVGHLPNISYLKSLQPEFSEGGFIKVDTRMRTNVEGMLAAGDITGLENQLIVACAQGTLAALTAAKYLREKEPWIFKSTN